MAKAKQKKGKAPVVNIDWTGHHKREKEREKDGGGNWLRRVKEGDYPFTIKKVKLGESSQGNKMFIVDFVGKEGKVAGKSTRDYFTFTAEALFKLRQLLEAIDMPVPKKAGRLDGSEMEGKDVGITLGDEEYEGKMRSKAQNYLPIDDLVADDDDEDSDDDDSIDSMDLDELVKYAKKNKIKIKGLKSMKLKKARKAVSDAVDADEDLEAVDLDDM